MKKTGVWVVLIIIIILIGGFWYFTMRQSAAPAAQANNADLGTYAYECDEHVTFTMTPASGMESISIAPKNNPAFPPAATLMQAEATSGVRYEGEGMVFTGRGEEVQLTTNGSTLNCSPVNDPGEAPFNFGD